MYMDREPKKVKFKKAYPSPQAFLLEAKQYFDWCTANPVKTPSKIKGFSYELIDRPYTTKGLCAYLGVAFDDFNEFAEDESKSVEWKNAIDYVNNVIFEQKFAGTASGLYQPLTIRDEKDAGGDGGGNTIGTITFVDGSKKAK